MNAASQHKKLRIHTGTHFHPFHTEEGRLDQLRFFDPWLKGIDTGIMDEPRHGRSVRPRYPVFSKVTRLYRAITAFKNNPVFTGSEQKFF